MIWDRWKWKEVILRYYTFGLLYGTEVFNGDLVIGISSLERSPLSASEIPGIAELGLSTLGKTFKLLGPDEVSSGIYAGSYPKETTFVPDPNCENNGGILDGSFCKFLYGKRFNIVNDEIYGDQNNHMFIAYFVFFVQVIWNYI